MHKIILYTLILTTLFGTALTYDSWGSEIMPRVSQIQVEKNPFRTSDITYVIRQDMDLGSTVAHVPKGSELIFDGGKIVNGELVSNNTRIKGKGILFDKVKIFGT